MNKYIMVSVMKDGYIGFNTNLDYVESEIDNIEEFYFDLEGVEEEDVKEYLKGYIDVEDGGNILYYDDEEIFVKIKKINVDF